ncbi:hypothetical protein C2G38_2170879 [Gigaspora rosea]|uniref:Uncharacterized protein n=1 Tax=Gigaspora rosea TaxID=44941 RepID=A0A397VRF9_9GLOM|nr:hypothetical protein C2G38_2170879 [Gigaspora rosea]
MTQVHDVVMTTGECERRGVGNCSPSFVFAASSTEVQLCRWVPAHPPLGGSVCGFGGLMGGSIARVDQPEYRRKWVGIMCWTRDDFGFNESPCVLNGVIVWSIAQVDDPDMLW